MNNYERFGRTESWKRGQEVEARFLNLLKKKLSNCREATLQEQFKHMDVICGDKKIDVKAMKRVNRGSHIQNEFTWIEFKNTAGGEGWIFGEGTHIAFEVQSGFIMVQKKDLARMATQKCNVSDLVNSSRDALYKGFIRRGRRDLISMVRMQDIMDLPHVFIPSDEEII